MHGSLKISRRFAKLAAAICLIFLGFSQAHAQTTLVWSDEFNGAAGSVPSASNWTYDTGGGGWGNGELEVYCAPFSSVSPCDPNNSNIYEDGNGNLVIKAILKNGTWTSGRLKTQGLQNFQYGRMEARIKMQVGDGFWPAFWMLGSNISTVGWPTCGEMDIMEWVQSLGPSTTSSHIHGPTKSGRATNVGTNYTFPNGGRIDDATYHTYGEIWAADSVQFYRDDYTKPFYSVTASSYPKQGTWVFNQPFFFILNLAIGGGGYPGTTDSTTPNPGTMLVDYVRVYQ